MPTAYDNGGRAGHRAWPHLRNLVFEVLQLAGTLRHIDVATVDHSDAGGVVAAVLHSSQSVERNAKSLLLTYVSHDSTHADNINL